MTSKFVPPSIELKAFNCPRCHALADQTWFNVYGSTVENTVLLANEDALKRVKAIPSGEGKTKEKYERFVAFVEKAITGNIFFGERFDLYVDQLWNVFVSKCRSCGELTIWRYNTILYPPTQYEIEPNDDLSDEIKADFNEARTILDLSPRGAAGLLRLCIQKLCKQLGQPGENINNDIAALVKAGLDPKVQKALDYVRVIGNEAVHPGTIDLNDNRATAAKLFELVNWIAFDMITRPKELDALYNSLPKNKTDAIMKRDGKAKAATTP